MNKNRIEDLLSEPNNLDYERMVRVIGHNNTKKVSAILEILKIDIQSVADSKMILNICEQLIESSSDAFLKIEI